MAKHDPAEKADFTAEDWSFLIVDDNPSALAALRTLMMVLGLAPPLEAAGGAEAQDLVRQHELDCIITDLRMEPMNGVEFVRWLRQSNEAGNPTARVLAISAYRDAEEIAAVAREGADAFLAKPLSLANLRAALDVLVRQSDNFTEIVQAPNGTVNLVAGPLRNT